MTAAVEIEAKTATMDLKSFSILIVEDTQMMRLLMLKLLKELGYANVAAVTNGQEALDLLRTRPIDLVLLDIQMPVLDGYETLKRMKADPRLKLISVLMVTAVEKIESVAKCIEMGAEDYLPKLFNPLLLNARIQSCLEKKILRERIADLERQPPSGS